MRIPDIGDFADVPVIEVHVAPGDVVAAEDPVLTLESDKATMDIPAPPEPSRRYWSRWAAGCRPVIWCCA
jgi:hypothetical protein